MESQKKKPRVHSSTESDDSSFQDIPSNEGQTDIVCDSDNDSNSSVEIMDIVKYPSATVLSKIEHSKSMSEESESKHCKKEKSSHKSFRRCLEKTKISAKHPKRKEKTINKIVTKDFSTKFEHKNEVQHEIVNKSDISSGKTKNISISISIKKNKNPGFLQTSTTNKENSAMRKKPSFSKSVSNKEEESLSSIYEESDAATCSYFKEKMPDISKNRKSTVKKRPENYGSRLNALLTDFKSHANNTRQFSEKKKLEPLKPKDQWRNEYPKTEICNQHSNSQSTRKYSCTESLSLPSSSLEFSYNNPKEWVDMHRKMSPKYSLNFIKVIVDLDTKWLEERERNIIPPPELLARRLCRTTTGPNNERIISEIKDAKPLPLFFESFDDYHHKYFSMLNVETWEKICLSTKANLNPINENNFTFCVDSFANVLVEYTKDHSLIRLDCSSACNVPAESSLAIVQLKLKNGQLKSTFGFIENFERKYIDLNESNKRQYQAPIKQLFFKMFVKSRKIDPQIKCLMDGKFVCSLYKETKQAEALYLMEFSPLLKDFLKPSLDTFYIHDKQLYDVDFFNVQQNISFVVGQEINLSPSKPKIMLLQGPPGSGKTSAIVSIASNLLRNKDDPKKILIVAPSHFALDEIGKQLVKSNELFVDPTNFVRLGPIENIHPKILNYSVHKYLEKYQMSYRSSNSNLDKNGMIFHCERTGKSSLKEQSIKRADRRDTIRNNERLKDHDEQQQIEKILSETSLILALPEDCWELRKFNLKFSCCLMDEVNQGTELDTLYPFALGIKKFLLISDPMQSPINVNSKTALKCEYNRSVMSRFQSYIINIYDKNPTITLSQQFRFSSRITDFVLKLFRSNYHVNSSYADKLNEFYPFKPYTVLEDQRDNGTKVIPYTEEIGVHLIISLCSYIIKKDSTSCIGIIVPSEKEQQAYQAAIIANILSSSVEVNTVDHFQGREKTVIILSCYHDFNKVLTSSTDYFGDSRKLYVALTRAISSLIICGPLQNVINNQYSTKCSYDIWWEIMTESVIRGCYFKFKSLDELRPSHILKT